MKKLETMDYVKAINLKVGQVVKFRDTLGTHTMKVSEVSKGFRKEMHIVGTILKTTNKDSRFDKHQVGSENFFFARYGTKIKVLG